MSGKTLLQNLLASCGISAAATATAASVASGAPDLSAEDQTAGTASLESLVAAAHLEGSNAGRLAERERFGAVLTNPEFAGREGLAINMLNTTDLTAEQIGNQLAVAPKPGAAPAASEPAPTPAPAPAGQREAADPIAENTSLVPPGQSATVDGQPDQVAVDNLWKGAIANVQGGLATGSVWDGLVPSQPAN